MSAKTSKYEISMTEQANAQWAFESWLKKHAGEEAAKALSTYHGGAVRGKIIQGWPGRLA